MACWRAAFTMAIDLSFGEKFAGRRRGVIGNCKVTAHFRITYRIALPMVGTGYDNPPNKKTDKRLGSFSYYVNYIYFSMIITWFISTHGWVALHLWVGISVVSHSFYARAQCSSFGFINTITIIKFIFVKLLQVEIVQLCAGAFTLKTFEWIYTSCLVTLAAIQTVSKIPIIIFLCSRMWLLLINEWSLPATRCTYGNTKLFTVEMLNSETN